MTDQAAQLIEILQDVTEHDEIRVDAAMELWRFPRPDVVAALTAAASSPSEEYLIVAAAGESLGEVWSQLDTVDADSYAQLQRAAQNEVKAVFEGKAPHLLEMLTCSD
jgi:hypothetical protein